MGIGRAKVFLIIMLVLFDLPHGDLVHSLKKRNVRPVGSAGLGGRRQPPKPPTGKQGTPTVLGGDFLGGMSGRVASRALLVTLQSPLTSQGGSHLKASRLRI